ncbi:MAG: carbon storage regulator CsrA [Candidatus Eremiobacteraeota bacterium]|nr:carbon storage regulator CsrA [Candidatus Eremiobacteraeota bacterium]
MLVLSRKLNESIIIDNRIELTILEVRGDNVRIGIKAPPAVKIYRSEVWKSVRDENISSSEVSGESLEDFSKKIREKNDG